MNRQIITTPNGERMVVIPEADYNAMIEAIEDREDIEAVRIFERRMADGDEELIPAEFANRLVDGENPVKVWRSYRGMTARELAEKTGLSAPYISEIEGGKKEGSVSAMKRIADALAVTLDDLVLSTSDRG